jgi:hypothetical protein
MSTKKLSEGEKLFCEWQLGMTGSFFSKLIEAIMIADSGNLEKLYESFPDLVDTVSKYQNVAGFWDDLKSRYEQQENVTGKIHW